MSEVDLACFGKIGMLGPIATALALFTEGARGSYWESGIFLWDVGAGIAVVSSSGAVVQTLRSRDFDLDV